VKLRIVFRIILYPLAFLALPLLVGEAASRAAFENRYSDPRPIEGETPAPPTHDPNKPTVAVLLGHGGTVVSDFLTPFELFGATGAFNVYAVAPKRQPTPLDGGLDVLPHYSLSDLDRLLKGSPDVIVVPGMFALEAPEQQAVVGWLKERVDDKTLVLSVCTGAELLAEAGLLGGRRATSHWAELGALTERYPETRWVRGQRYVDDGNLVATAGLTAGIDGTLHLLDRLLGRQAALEAAQRINYTDIGYLDSPRYAMPRLEPGDATLFLLNQQYRWVKPTLGVYLYNGASELELAALMDPYAATYSANLLTLGATRQAVTTQHGLYLSPRRSLKEAPSLDRLLIAGGEARSLTGNTLGSWAEARSLQTEFLHADLSGGAQRGAFDAPLLDLARWANVPIVAFAAKRLDLTASELPLEGRGWPIHLFFVPLSLGLLGVGLAAALDLHFMGVQRSRRAHHADGQTPTGPSKRPR